MKMKNLSKLKHSKSKLLITYFFILFPVINFAQSFNNDQKLQTFLTIAEDLFQKAELPGAGISIIYNGDILYKGGFGYSNITSKEPITENSLFFIGSTTKAFTGVVAAKLVENQKIEWKKPIINYIPDFKLSEPYVAKHINIEDLFTHMTGLSNKDNLWLDKNITREQVYEQVSDLEFTHSFRGEWGYNNHAYVIIGKVLETVTNETWESLIENEIFSPLGMTSSYTTHQGFINDKNHVTGYYRDGKTEQAHSSSDKIGPAGAISSTPNDISKWLKMLVNKGNYNGQQLITPKEYNYIMGPKRMSFTDTCTVRYYSIGWGGSMTHSKRTLRHGGAIKGNNARVSIMPDDGFGIFIMTNQRSDYKDILTDYAENIFVNGNFKRDLERESKLISYNRFIQFQNLLLDVSIESARKYHNTLMYKDFESNMDRLGQSLLNAGYMAPALFVLELNVSDHPKSFQAHNSYASALLKNNKKREAIVMYEKALEINPKNKIATKALKELLEN